MATNEWNLAIGAAILPDGTTGNAAPGTVRVKSTAAAPSSHFEQLLFDPTTDEMCYWQFRMPNDYASGPVLKVQYKMISATTGNVVISGRIAAITPGDAIDTDAKALGTDNLSAATAVPGTVGRLAEISLTLTNDDGLAGGDFAIVRLARNASNGSDTATGDMAVTAVSLQYTTV